MAKIVPLRWAGTCPYCAEVAPLFRCEFDEPFVVNLIDNICGRCANQLNDDSIPIPPHPLDSPQMDVN